MGCTGDQTPLYDAFFASGFSSLRGFEFHAAGPHANSVLVGGDFEVLAGAEYLFPITADDSLRGVLLLDTGPGPTGCQWMRRATTIYPLRAGADLRNEAAEAGRDLTVLLGHTPALPSA